MKTPHTFRVEVRERLIEDVLGSLDFKSGPTPWGGLYAYEQQRIMFPSVDNPIAQPWGSFNQTELLIVGAQSILNSVLFQYAAKGIAAANRKLKLQAARAMVARDIAAFCASQENGGAGTPICDAAATPAR